MLYFTQILNPLNSQRACKAKLVLQSKAVSHSRFPGSIQMLNAATACSGLKSSCSTAKNTIYLELIRNWKLWFEQVREESIGSNLQIYWLRITKRIGWKARTATSCQTTTKLYSDIFFILNSCVKKSTLG